MPKADSDLALPTVLRRRAKASFSLALKLLLGMLALLALGVGLHQAGQRVGEATLVPPDAGPAVAQPSMWIPTVALAATPTRLGQLNAPAANVQALAAVWAGGQLTVTFRARQIVGDYLFEPPALHVAGTVTPATAEALKAARRAWLNLPAQGEADAWLVFAVEAVVGVGEVVFNPASQPESLVAPRVSAPVTWGK